jgi:hypothetical protein
MIEHGFLLSRRRLCRCHVLMLAASRLGEHLEHAIGVVADRLDVVQEALPSRSAPLAGVAPSAPTSLTSIP